MKDQRPLSVNQQSAQARVRVIDLTRHLPRNNCVHLPFGVNGLACDEPRPPILMRCGPSTERLARRAIEQRTPRWNGTNRPARHVYSTHAVPGQVLAGMCRHICPEFVRVTSPTAPNRPAGSPRCLVTSLVENRAVKTVSAMCASNVPVSRPGVTAPACQSGDSNIVAAGPVSTQDPLWTWALYGD